MYCGMERDGKFRCGPKGGPQCVDCRYLQSPAGRPGDVFHGLTRPVQRQDPKYFVTCSRDKSVRVWSVQGNRLKHRLHAPNVGGAPECYGFDDKERYMFIRTTGTDTTVFDLNDSGRIVAKLAGVHRLLFTPLAEDWVFSASTDLLRVWRFGGGKISPLVSVGAQSEPADIWSVSPTGTSAFGVIKSADTGGTVLRRVSLDPSRPLSEFISVENPEHVRNMYKGNFNGKVLGAALLEDCDKARIVGADQDHVAAAELGSAMTFETQACRFLESSSELYGARYFDLSMAGKEFFPRTMSPSGKIATVGDAKITFEPKDTHRYCVVAYPEGYDLHQSNEAGAGPARPGVDPMTDRSAPVLKCDRDSKHDGKIVFAVEDDIDECSNCNMALPDGAPVLKCEVCFPARFVCGEFL